MLTVPYTQKARVNASSGIRSGSKLWRVYGRPEGTLTLTLCVGERVAVPAACRLSNMKNQPQLQKAAVVPMTGVEPAPFASLGWAVLRLLSYIGVLPGDRGCFQCAIKAALFA